MNQNFIQDAIRTESVIEEVMYNKQNLLSTLHSVVLAAEQMDRVKKCVFYEGGQPVTGELIGINPRVFHAIIGNISEAGELAAALLGALSCNKPLDTVNVLEELGDQAWYNAILFDELKVDPDLILYNVISKLKKRFPHKFESERADRNNRNLVQERATMENMLQLQSLAKQDFIPLPAGNMFDEARFQKAQ